MQSEKVKIRLSSNYISNAIAFFALFVSLISVAWQFCLAFVGAELKQLDYSGHKVEFRCNDTVENCWSDGEGNNGRLVVILPIFFSNTGASEFSDALVRVDLELTVENPDNQIQMFATEIWRTTQTSNRGSLPFRPIVIHGRSANGHELRFVQKIEQERLSWSKFTNQIINNEINTLTLETTSTFAIDENETITNTCVVKISNELRTALKERNGSRRVHLTTICQDSTN